MIEYVTPTNIAFDIYGMVVALIPIFGMPKGKERASSRYFTMIAAMSALYLLGDIATLLLLSQDSLWAVVLRNITFLLGVFAGLCALATLVIYVDTTLVTGKKSVFASVPMRRGLYALALAGAVFCWLGSLRGGVLAVLAGVFAAPGLIFVIVRLVGGWDRVDKRQALSLLICVTLPLLAMILQPLATPLNLSPIAAVLSLTMLYISIQGEQSRTLWQKEIELSKSNVELMISQIQPHFLYNSLVAISQLCDISPVEASDMVSKFSQYLKVNVDSLQQYEPIPFEDELDHAKIYLYIEQKRFEEKLRIEMDIQALDFKVPVLSLQPIVENAVRHGVTKREEGGTVRITSEDKGSHWCITVADDGVGFAANRYYEDDRTHLGIENVRNRLQSVCAGAMSVQSVPGKGTTVTMTIPKEVPHT